MAIDVFNIAAIVLMWAVVALGAFALLGDALVQRVKRWRGTARKRCPKCWYDLSETVARPSRPCATRNALHAANDSHGRDRRAAVADARATVVLCSECGYEVKRERQFYKGRRRWGLVALAMLMLVGSYAAHVTPGVRERGWVAAVPTTALILAMPWVGSPEPRLDSGAPAPITLRNDLAREVLVRAHDRKLLWGWQERLLVERLLRGDSSRRPVSREWYELYGYALELLQYSYEGEPWWQARADALAEVHLFTRPVLPAGVPMYATWRLNRWNYAIDYHVELEPVTDGGVESRFIAVPDDGSGTPLSTHWADDVLFLGVVEKGIDSMQFRVTVGEHDFNGGAPRLLRTYPLEIPVRVTGSIDEILTPVVSDEVDAFINSQLEPTLLSSVARDEFSLRIWRDSFSAFDVPDDLYCVTMAFHIEVLRDGELVGETSAWVVSWSRWVVPGAWDQPVKLTWFDAEGHSFTEDEQWTVRLTGDPVTALRNINCDRYWKGQIELPLRLDVWAER